MSSTTLDRSLVAYSLAGGAGLLAAGSTEAAVIYSGALNQNVAFSSGSHTLNVGGLGSMDFNFTSSFPGGGLWTYGVEVSGTGMDIAQGSVIGNADNIASGSSIDGSLGFTGKDLVVADFWDDGTSLDGEFAANSTGFLGFESASGNFGWVRLSFGAPLDPTGGFTIVDWAYENTGAAIQAGQTSSGGGGVPLPGAAALAALAAGATGLRGWRKRERAA